MINTKETFEEWLNFTYPAPSHEHNYNKVKILRAAWEHQQQKINVLEQDYKMVKDEYIFVAERDIAPLDIENIELKKQLLKSQELNREAVEIIEDAYQDHGSHGQMQPKTYSKTLRFRDGNKELFKEIGE
jgi:hypothetical protein